MPKWCAYCRKLNVKAKTIKRPTDFRRLPRSEYIHVCPKCIIENHLEDAQEYNLSNIEEFVDRNSSNAVVPTILETTNGEKYLSFVNGSGQYMSLGELKFIAESLLQTIELEGLDEFFEETNTFNRMSHSFSSDPDDEDKFMIPLEDLGIRRKEFDPNKNWSFKCGNCSTKISSKDGGEYLSINPNHNFQNPAMERACSDACMKVIAKEHILDFINGNHFEKYFNLTDLDEKVKNYISYL